MTDKMKRSIVFFKKEIKAMTVEYIKDMGLKFCIHQVAKLFKKKVVKPLLAKVIDYNRQLGFDDFAGLENYGF